MKSKQEIINFLKEQIHEITFEQVSKDSMTDNSVILELGLDSLDFAQLMLAGETFVGHKVNEKDINWANVRTIEQLADILQ